ncbi:MAG: DUF2828 family protein [Oscillospiraceae bacterium]|nr:DUF2828 family protein [Oscillospiraceae bacterium]
MLKYLQQEANLTHTENGALTHSTSGSFCLDLFFRAGAMRNASEQEIADVVTRSFVENAMKTLKIIFFARDVRGGLGERRFFRIAMRTLTTIAPEAVARNVPYFPEYGRFDDLCILLHTPCENVAVKEIKKQLDADKLAMQNEESASLLAKWLPSVNASSQETRRNGRHLASLLGMTECNYRKLLASLRRYTDILENRLREKDYTFDYGKQPSKAMFKYRQAFWRNDEERYSSFLDSVEHGDAELKTSTLYPYEIVRRCFTQITEKELRSLDLTWKNLPDYEENTENAIAVIDGSGSMTWGEHVRPLDVALSLGIYFAEHNKGAFAKNFITFSRHPRLVKITGTDIVEKVKYCSTFNEVANTDLEAVFDLILSTALKHHVPQEELPHRIYIISDMEFDGCVIGGNEQTLYTEMKKRYSEWGYTLPQVVFWNVNSRSSNMPVTMRENGTALISGFTPALFDMIIADELSPVRIMEEVISNERYARIA